MKTSRARQKASGLFHFGVVLREEFNQQAAFQIPTCISHWGAWVERKKVLCYSICKSSGLNASTSTSLANLRSALLKKKRKNPPSQ
jgi:hypothetical protein